MRRKGVDLQTLAIIGLVLTVVAGVLEVRMSGPDGSYEDVAPRS